MQCSAAGGGGGAGAGVGLGGLGCGRGSNRCCRLDKVAVPDAGAIVCYM